MDQGMITVNFQMAINIWLSAEEAGDEEVVQLWATLLDAHSWVVYDQAPAITRAGVLTLLSWNTAQELLDNHPWLSPPLVLACFWLLRRDQLVLVPQLWGRTLWVSLIIIKKNIYIQKSQGISWFTIYTPMNFSYQWTDICKYYPF